MGGGQGRRNRGVVLSATGIQRLSHAISAIEMLENGGDRFTMEELSDRTGISTSTLSRLWTSKSGVDRRTLLLLFSAFKLDLVTSDLQPSGEAGEQDASTPRLGSSAATSPIRYPSGPVPLDSQRYISRTGVDDRAFQEIVQPGCVIRIKAPSGFGKTSLILRLLRYAEHLGYAIAQIDLQQADAETLADAHGFLRWLCAVLALRLSVDANIDAYWDDSLGSKLSTTLYVRELILAQLDRPLVLVLNEVERVFEYPDTANQLLPLLRSWHEEAQHDEAWEKLRLVVAYSTAAYLPLDINQSPFNVGLPLPLPEFSQDQVLALTAVYGVSWTQEACDRLVSLIGGKPSLVNIALYHLQKGMGLEDLLQSASTQQGIYHNHLQRLLAQIHAHAQWAEPLKGLVKGEGAIALDPVLAYKLEGMGLIKAIPGGWQLSCDLYRAYFQTYLFNP